MTLARTALLALAAGASACGGAAPLLHGAHTLPSGQSSLGAGVAGQIATGQAQADLDAARQLSADGGVASDAERKRWLAGAAAHTLLAPGMSPWVALRVGLGGGLEGGLTYTGRSARADARWSPGGSGVTWSIGGGASALLARPSDAPSAGSDPNGAPRRSGDLPGLDASGVSGWGADVPVLLGWRSDGSVVEAWLGPRLSIEHASGTAQLAIETSDRVVDTPVSWTRWSAGGVVGLAVGVRPITVALELDLAYAHVGGDATYTLAPGAPVVYSVASGGLTLAPGAAVRARF